MLKQTVSYKDFDDNPCTETLYFNISKSELSDIHGLNELRNRFEETAKSFEEPHELSQEEIGRILTLVKDIMKMSYGVKSADGKRFVKKPELWEEFTQTAAYDEFLMSLFENPEKANNFILGVFPKEYLEKAVAQQSQSQTVELPTAAPVLKTAASEPTDEQLLKMDPQSMTPDQLRRAYLLRSQQ